MINTVTYVSNGYVVFMPDVHFTIGTPVKVVIMRWSAGLKC